jgi:hypothetical protein
MWEGLTRKTDSFTGGAGSGSGGVGGDSRDRNSDLSRIDDNDRPVDYDEQEMAPPTSFGGKGGW